MSSDAAGAAADVTGGLAARLPRMRWFADKSTPILSATHAERLVIPDAGGVELALVDVRMAGGVSPRRYVVVESIDGHDATCTPGFVRWLLETVLAGRTVAAARDGRFVGHCVPPVAACDGRGRDAERLEVTPLGPDASNTSLVVRSAGRGFVVKLFRTCRPGIQPEVEVGEFFATASPWSGTPRLTGWLEFAQQDRSVAIATVHEFVPGCVTAWDHLVGLLGGPEHAAAPAFETAARVAAALGRTTAQMHRALASRPDRAAFAPLQATPDWSRVAAAGMRSHAAAVFTRIGQRLPQFPSPLARRLAAVLDVQPRLLARFAALAEPPITCPLVRVHGDYHLGQVLVAPPIDGVADTTEPRLLVIDFEGEPGRSLDDRRGRTVAAKDVAGMCRSFDYLARVTAARAGRPGDPAIARRLEQAFLDSYRAGAAGQPWWPATAADADRLLAAFALDKAVYELAYESDNRPDWIDVPLAALEALAAEAGPADTA